MWTLREIGVRELRETLGRTLREVSQGERVRVTRHGHVLAEIVPVESDARDERLRSLIADGRLTPRARPRPRRAPRLQVTSRSASEIVLAERNDDT